MSKDELIITGGRQNNLKNINLTLPHNKVIVITGVSGSGKSSLAFDTIFAEGQWRFIESLSTYARLFLEKLDRPDVDSILNIRPAIALEQKNPVRGSRSTVGTLTELNELFRLLYAKIAAPFCPRCGNEVRKWDPSQITAELLDQYSEAKAVITFQSTAPAAELKQRGFYRVWHKDETIDIDALPGSDHPSLDIVLDRLVIRDEPRLSDSIEMAWREGHGKLKVAIMEPVQGQQFTVRGFSAENACDNCEVSLPAP